MPGTSTAEHSLDVTPAFAYNEQALIGGVAGSIWRGSNHPEDFVLEEYQCPVEERTLRADLWVDLHDSEPGEGRDFTFLVEGKRCRSRYLRAAKADPWRAIPSAMFRSTPSGGKRQRPSAIRQVLRYPRDGADYRSLLIFGQPECGGNDDRTWRISSTWLWLRAQTPRTSPTSASTSTPSGRRMSATTPCRETGFEGRGYRPSLFPSKTNTSPCARTTVPSSGSGEASSPPSTLPPLARGDDRGPRG